MKRFKHGTLLFFLTILLLVTSSIKVNADMGPKPFVNIEITGMEDISYTATLISKDATGPHFDYEEWLEGDYSNIEYHPIMEYVDSEGYKWVGEYWSIEGNGSFNWGYYPPRNFKVLLMTDDGEYYATEVLERYAFATYYKVNASETIAGELDAVRVVESVKPNYNYGREIVGFLIRVILTVAIEIGIALLFGFRKKRQLITILIVNMVTQIFLNGTLNIVTYYQGILSAMLLFVIAEIFVLLFETIFYSFYFKEDRLKGGIYGFVANLVTLVAGFGLYVLELAIFS